MNSVVVRLIGGLGNQLFQYAAGRAVSIRLGLPLLLDVSGFESYGLRRYELSGMKIEAGIASERDLRDFSLDRKVDRFIERAFRFFGMAGSKDVFRELSFLYDERIERLSRAVYLDGYWQSERYFSDIKDHLLQEFSLREFPNNENTAVFEDVRRLGGSAVSLHIRRGDYVSNPQTARYHGVCSLDYYRAAVQYVASNVEDPHFFIFSDDHEWVKGNFDIEYPVVLVDVNGPDSGIWDMAIMRQCSHHIIANSSFSWWGAWLGLNDAKVVVAPKYWFKDPSIDTCDLIPKEWIRL